MATFTKNKTPNDATGNGEAAAPATDGAEEPTIENAPADAAQAAVKDAQKAAREAQEALRALQQQQIAAPGRSGIPFAAYEMPAGAYQMPGQPQLPPAPSTGRDWKFWVPTTVIGVLAVAGLIVGMFFIGSGSRPSNDQISQRLSVARAHQRSGDSAERRAALRAQHVREGSAFRRRLARAKRDAFNRGKNAGYSSGQSAGYASGSSAGRTEGFTQGHNQGFSEGAASAPPRACSNDPQVPLPYC
jgi:hypothetical protein